MPEHLGNATFTATSGLSVETTQKQFIAARLAALGRMFVNTTGGILKSNLDITRTLNPAQMRWLSRAGATVTNNGLSATEDQLWTCKILGKTRWLLDRRGLLTIQ